MGRASHYSERKDDILCAIETLTRREGRGPSVRAVASEVGCSVATLHSYLTRLRNEGLIDWVERTHRSLRVRPQVGAAKPVAAATPPPTSPASNSSPTPVSAPRALDPTVDVGF